ncbi:MAG: DUF4349 domain-containing protein [Pseudomonadota bacterium]
MNTIGFRYGICAVLLCMLVSCGQQDASVIAPESARDIATSAKMVNDSAGPAVQGLTEISEPIISDAKKYIALRHHLQIETSPEKMQASFDAALKHCEALSCQLLSANFNRETPYNPPSASLSVRVPPRNVSIFLTGLAKNGELMQHGRESEDKTNQVVDADARIRNLTNLRDRLRLMLSDKTAKFKDIIDVERELANTQSELDSMTSLRKILALETDLVAVNIDFTAAQGITEQGFFAPVVRALQNAGQVLMESIATVITFVMAAIPWLLIGMPVVWLVRRYWVKLKYKQ